MHDIRTVKCPKCSAEVQVFDTDRRATCPECGCSFEVPSLLDEKLAAQAKEAMEKSVEEIRQQQESDQKGKVADSSGKLHKIIRGIMYVLILVILLCILLMTTSTHIVN